MKELRWGETPWDKMSRKELLREVEMMWSAIDSAGAVLVNLQLTDKDHPYWNTGPGGTALEKCNQVRDKIAAEYHKEDVYKAFFRYSDSLLFKASTSIGHWYNWLVCSDCDWMCTTDILKYATIGGSEAEGTCPACNGKFRAITWEDMSPVKKEKKDG